MYKLVKMCDHIAADVESSTSSLFRIDKDGKMHLIVSRIQLIDKA